MRALDLTLRSGRYSQLARRLCLAFSVALTFGFRLRTVSVKGAGLADDFPGARLIHCLPVVEVAELKQMADAESASVSIDKKVLKTGREIWTLRGGS